MKRQESKGFLGSLRKALDKSRSDFTRHLSRIFTHFPKISDELWEQIEDVLIQADVGVKATVKIVESLRLRVEKQGVEDTRQLFKLLEEEIFEILNTHHFGFKVSAKGLHILLITGVNGTGKTTTIAKIAHRAKREGKKVLLAAADTFRAAAIEQLVIWAGRVGVEVVRHQRGADAAAVVFDAIQASKARRVDLLLIDTAGRLHTKIPLMEELKKIKRVVSKEAFEAEIETLLVIDATTGQNGLIQARIFKETLDIDGIILTKLDGTAKGGIVVAIQVELGIPVKLVGTGETLEDLEDFNPREFARALCAPL